MNPRLLTLLTLLAAAVALAAGLNAPAAVARPLGPDSAAAATGLADVGGCPLFPADNVWNAPVDTLPVHRDSATFINTIGAGLKVHVDFGSGLWQGGPIGIPFVVVPGSQPKVPVSFQYADESDPGPYPIPPDAPIEGGRQSRGDRHILVVDKDNCILYETWSTYPNDDGSWRAGSGARFDLRSNALRPDTWTSADAAGLPILPGLARYDEAAAGEIRHALRFTVPETRRAYIWPARHYASSLQDSRYPPMGLRLRLKAGYDISGFSPEIQVILRALKTYGMILADNGSPWFISGVPDERWNNDHLHEMDRILGRDFEVVDTSSQMAEPDSGRVAGAAPTASPLPPTASPTATLPLPTSTASPLPSPSPTQLAVTPSATVIASPTVPADPSATLPAISETPTAGHTATPVGTPSVPTPRYRMYLPRLWKDRVLRR